MVLNRKKCVEILLIICTLLLLLTSNLFGKDIFFRPAIYTLSTYYQAECINILEDDLDNYRLYAEVTYNSKGKLLEEKFYVSNILVCKRIYSPRFNKALREENYEWDENGNKTIYETKNFYGEKSTFREKKITSAVYESITGDKKGLYVEYELFSSIKDIEIKRIKQRYEKGKLKYSWIYYYDEEGTLIVVEDRNVDNLVVRIGRPDSLRLIVAEDYIDNAIIWRNVD